MKIENFAIQIKNLGGERCSKWKLTVGADGKLRKSLEQFLKI